MQSTLRFTTLGVAFVASFAQGTQLGFHETCARIRDRSLFDWLHRELEYFDDSLLDDHDRREVLTTFENLTKASNDEFGAHHDGLTLLATYCFVAIQQ